MDIEDGDQCKYDYLYVSYIRIGKLCGSINGLVFNRTSYQSWITLQFVSDNSVGGKGYEAEFRVIINTDQQHVIPSTPGI